MNRATIKSIPQKRPHDGNADTKADTEGTCDGKAGYEADTEGTCNYKAGTEADTEGTCDGK